MEPAYINYDMIRWARERGALSVDDLATRLGVDHQEIRQWERGQSHPPFGRAQEIADVLRIPFGFLFLPGPPSDKPPIPDFRRVHGERRPLSPDFVDLLNDVLVKHDWYVEFATSSGAKPIPFVGKYSISTPIERIVGDLRDVITPEALRRQSYDWSDYLRLLAQRAEEVGIIVMRGGVVRGNAYRPLTIREFRGFAISNPLAPLIFINSKDAQSAQIFTLAHELVHLWIGQTGISNPEPASPTTTREEVAAERTCNEVAAELLVPAEEFAKAWRTTPGTDNTRVEVLARRFRVSVPVILRRAVEREEITRSGFFGLLKSYQQKIAEIEKKREEDENESSKGGNFYNTFFARNSHKFSQAILTSVKSGRLTSLEAARLLGVRTATIPKLAERMAP